MGSYPPNHLQGNVQGAPRINNRKSGAGITGSMLGAICLAII